jgi:hypothetical protein
MDRDTVTQIKIGTHRFGIVGLKKVLENMAETYADQIAEFKVKGTPALIIDGKEMDFKVKLGSIVESDTRDYYATNRFSYLEEKLTALLSNSH